jgi:predicted dithiol-disulfide oxidoreductase (DUF899 family)
MFIDQLGHPAHLNARDTSFAVVSRAPIGKIEAYRKRMGWTVRWCPSVRDRLQPGVRHRTERPDPTKYQDGESFG